MRIFLISILPLLTTLFGLVSFSQGSATSAKFIHNDGQWLDHIDFKLPLNSGDIYFEGNRITYSLYDKSLYGKAKHGEYDQDFIQGHAYKVELINAKKDVQYIFSEPQVAYHNFFIGNDQSKWKTNVKSYDQIYAKDIYPGIDYNFYEYYGQTKYDFIVFPSGDASDLLLKYDGQDKISLKKGHLVIQTSIGEVIEQSPYAYQHVNGEEKKVNCVYKLRGNLMYFDFPDGYDHSLPLVIDPVLTFATYTGSSADNFGCTATDDLAGNMYVGGTVFSAGYPTTTGAFQVSFGGANIDMGITKFSANGSSIIYSSYVGGSGNEIPHSLVVDDNNNLIILGTSNSNNYPISATAYQSTMNAGTPTTMGGYGFNYVNGCDLVITKFNATGNALIGSTFLGGSGNDGLNLSSLLHYNYGDAFRGEVINGLNGEIIVASTTASSNFPLTAGAPQTTLNGPSDAILVKMNTNLSNLLFSTYLGGSGRETGNSVQLNSSGEMYITGGTLSSDFPQTSNGLFNSYQGGDADGYIARFSASGNTLMNATYIGTSNYDQNYFVQTDLDDDVYVIGQTDGNYPILNAGFSNPNSGQYIQKLTPDLTTSLMSTTIGRSIGAVDIAVNAFLVSDCDFIYLSGWGGSLNGTTSLGAHATNSSTVGMPITSDAFQSTTDGSDFYLAVLAPDAGSLLYGTYFGGSTSHEHADGGTSRFDKSGTVYQAVCAGCGGNSDFPTTSGAWSNINNSTNCNLGAFKFDLGSITPAISVPQPYVCIPSAYQFNNNSSGGNQYFWYFGDGDSSHLYEPAHTYTDTGNYEVMLIVADSTGCLQSDTTFVYVDVFALGNATVSIVDTICQGDSAYLESGGGATYQWFPSSFLSNPNGQNTYAFPTVTTEYMVVATDSCGRDTALITVPVFDDPFFTIPDTLICAGFPVVLEAYGGTAYSWHPDPSIQNPGSSTPTANPPSSTTFYVDITTPSGCIITDSVFVETINNLPIPGLTEDTTICKGDQILLTAQGGDTYSWTPFNLLTDIIGNTANTNIQTTTQFFVQITNACGSVQDSVTVEVIDVYPTIVEDTIICPGEQATLWATGGTNYNWTPANTLTEINGDTVMAQPTTPTVYEVEVQNAQGCSKTLNVLVDLFTPPYTEVEGPTFIIDGQEITLTGATNGASYYWSTEDTVFCSNCYELIITPDRSDTYYFTGIDTNSCRTVDSITVYLDGILYVPNTFTPNGDGFNEYFKVIAREIHDYQLYIFDRWGQLVFETNDTEATWDGRHNGHLVQIDTYIWKIEYLDNLNVRHEFIGHVNVLR